MEKLQGKITLGGHTYDAELELEEQPGLDEEQMKQFQQFFSTYRQEINAYLAARFREAYLQYTQEDEEGG